MRLAGHRRAAKLVRMQGGANLVHSMPYAVSRYRLSSDLAEWQDRALHGSSDHAWRDEALTLQNIRSC